MQKIFNKKYLIWGVGGLIFQTILIITTLTKQLPFANSALGGLSLVFLGGAIFYTRKLFWIFLMMLPLETSVVSSHSLLFSLRAYQWLGIILILATLFLYLIGKKELRRFNLLGFQEKTNDKKIENDKSENNFSWLDYWIFIFPFLGLCSLINSPDRNKSIKLTIIIFSFVALYWLMRNYLQTIKQQEESWAFFLLGSLPVVLLGIYQVVAPKIGNSGFMVMSGRINGTFLEPDWLGIYLVFVWALLLWSKFWLNSNKQFKGRINWLINGIIFLVLINLILTVARSAWLGVISVTLVYFGLKFKMIRALKKTRKKQAISNLIKELAMFGFMGLLSFGLINQFNLSSFHFTNRATSSFSGQQKITISCEKKSSRVPQRITSLEELKEYDCRHINLEEIEGEKNKGYQIKEVYRPDPNINLRKDIYRKTVLAIRAHPLIGQGWGSAGIILGQDEQGTELNTSNIFLEVWLSVGLIGLMVFLVIIFSPLLTAFNELINPSHRNSFFISGLIVLLFVAMMVPNLFNSGLLMGVFWFWLASAVTLKTFLEERTGE